MPLFTVVRSFAVLLAVPFLLLFQAPAGGPQAIQCFVAVDTTATGGVASIQYLQVDPATHSVVPFMVKAPAAGSSTWPGAFFAHAAAARVNSPLVTTIPSQPGFRSYYIGADSKLYAAQFVNGNWSSTAIAPAVTCNDLSCLAAGTFLSAAGVATPSLFFISPNNFINYIKETAPGVWSDPEDIPLGPTPRTGSPLLTANFSSNHETHVFFIGDDNLIHDYYLRNAEWSSTAVDTSAQACRNSSPLVAVNKDGYHLFYFGEDNGIHSLTFKGTKWESGFIDKKMRASTASTIGFDSYTGDLVYEDSEYRLHLLHKDGDTWRNSIIILPSQFGPDYGTPLAACKGYVFYKSNNVVVEFRIVKG